MNCRLPIADCRLKQAMRRADAHTSRTAAPAPHRKSKVATRKARAAGLSVVELLIALAISAWLLTAVMVSLDASFYAYANASESASAQSAGRLIVQRVMRMIRTSSLVDAYDPSNAAVKLAQPSLPPVQCVGIQMVDTQGRLIKLWWQANTTYGDNDVGDLMYQADSGTPEVVIDQVRVQRDTSNAPYLFTLASRDSKSGLLLDRATIDLTVEAGHDATLTLESSQSAAAPVRLIASATPRRNIDE